MRCFSILDSTFINIAYYNSQTRRSATPYTTSGTTRVAARHTPYKTSTNCGSRWCRWYWISTKVLSAIRIRNRQVSLGRSTPSTMMQKPGEPSCHSRNGSCSASPILSPAWTFPTATKNGAKNVCISGRVGGVKIELVPEISSGNARNSVQRCVMKKDDGIG